MGWCRQAVSLERWHPVQEWRALASRHQQALRRQRELRQALLLSLCLPLVREAAHFR